VENDQLTTVARWSLQGAFGNGQKLDICAILLMHVVLLAAAASSSSFFFWVCFWGANLFMDHRHQH
jgi:hypothetical protein